LGYLSNDQPFLKHADIVISTLVFLIAWTHPTLSSTLVNLRITHMGFNRTENRSKLMAQESHHTDPAPYLSTSHTWWWPS